MQKAHQYLKYHRCTQKVHPRTVALLANEERDNSGIMMSRENMPCGLLSLPHRFRHEVYDFSFYLKLRNAFFWYQ